MYIVSEIAIDVVGDFDRYALTNVSYHAGGSITTVPVFWECRFSLSMVRVYVVSEIT